MSQSQDSVFVVFGKIFPAELIAEKRFDVIVADGMFKKDVESLNSKFLDLNTFVDPGSIHEASKFSEELSRIVLSDGSRLSKSFMYEGYELWWMYCNSMFLLFCVPYTQYKRLLEFVSSYKHVSFYNPLYKSLFAYFVEAHGGQFEHIKKRELRSSQWLSLGIFVQIILTFFSILVLLVKRPKLGIFIGDRFDKNKDHDARMIFIYQELRRRGLYFMEFVRSHESWKMVLQHFYVRNRPVVYSEAVAFVGRFLGLLTGGRARAERIINPYIDDLKSDPEARFKLLVATHYIHGVYADIWSIRIMKWILGNIGIRAMYIAASLDRNFHTVFGCKLNAIPMTGILHGVASKDYNIYDFLPAFDGEKSLSVDIYGVWSQWWREYYLKNSRAYKPEQLIVSGPMRPLEMSGIQQETKPSLGERVRVLFMSEQTAVPDEVMPYFRKLLKQNDIELTIKFRPYRDGFEDWLLVNELEILKLPQIKIVKGGMQEAIQNVDVVVGCHSTGVLEALLQFKTPIFIRSKKWGDYYSMTESEKGRYFFAENPTELIAKIRGVSGLPQGLISELREQYFGDPQKNGSVWVVDRLVESLKNSVN